MRIPGRDELETLSPGRQARHYAPRIPLVIDPTPTPRADHALLSFRAAETAGWAAVEVLSERGDLVEAASRLFAAMRRLDALDVAGIVATGVPEHGLGRAIMDRLRRAAQRP